jgi:glycosyltransferase involved in cell wall biosynthesis
MGIPHVWHLREFGDLDYRLVPDLGRTAQKWLITRADGVIAISNSIREHYQLNSASRIRVVYSGVAWESDFDRLREEAERGHSRHGDYTFALVGLLHPAKGQETAIRALHQIVQHRCDVKLVLAGSGPMVYRRQLELLVSRLGLNKHVEFRGYTGDIFSVYQKADAVLMCSTNEAMGRVTAEAMAASRPVIGYCNAGTREIIEHEKTGLLYDGGSEALADCMLRFLEKPAWASELGENGWYNARDRFTIERYAESVFEVLRNLPGSNVLFNPELKSISRESNGIGSQRSIAGDLLSRP